MNTVKVQITSSNQNYTVTERLWAEDLSGGLYLLKNIPFEATGYAEGDIVYAVNQQGTRQVIAHHYHSGNGTLRIFFRDSTSRDATEILNELKSVGCEYERGTHTLIAVTIPSTLSCPFVMIANYLDEAISGVIENWEIAKRMIREPPLATPVDMGKVLTKVWLPLCEPELFGGERLLAKYLGDNRYRLQSAPFDIEGYAKDDIIRLTQDNLFDSHISIVQDSGNGTIQLLFGPITTKESSMVLEYIKAAGHNYDTASQSLISITVAPGRSSFDALVDYLDTISSRMLDAWRVAKVPHL